MLPDAALRRWGRHLPSCPRDEDTVPTYFPNEGDAQWWFEQNPCTCDLTAELARQAEWARLAELVIAWDVLCNSMGEDPETTMDAAVSMVTLARRLRGEGT